MAMNPNTQEELSGNLRAAQTMTEEFWTAVFDKTDFEKCIEKRYKVAHVSMLEELREETEPTIADE